MPAAKDQLSLNDYAQIGQAVAERVNPTITASIANELAPIRLACQAIQGYVDTVEAKLAQIVTNTAPAPAQDFSALLHELKTLRKAVLWTSAGSPPNGVVKSKNDQLQEIPDLED